MAGSGLIIGGRRILVPGLDITNWIDDPQLRLRRGEDFTRRPQDARVTIIMCHTTKGLPAKAGDPPQAIRPGFGPSVSAGKRASRLWNNDNRQAGAHLIIDFDGRIFQGADLVLDETFGCKGIGWNSQTIHIEYYQGSDGTLYDGEIDNGVILVDAITREMPVPIQRQIPHRPLGALKRFLRDGARGVVGIVGHRECSDNRGPGDPGTAIINRFGKAGYEPVNFDQPDCTDLDNIGDRALWVRRQRELGLKADGVPGPRTVERLKAEGYSRGIWVSRPGDDVAPSDLRS